MTQATVGNCLLPTSALAACGLLAGQASAAVYVQCPGDTNGDARSAEIADPRTSCASTSPPATASSNMADGKLLYIFGFSDVTGCRRHRP